MTKFGEVHHVRRPFNVQFSVLTRIFDISFSDGSFGLALAEIWAETGQSLFLRVKILLNCCHLGKRKGVGPGRI